MSIFSTTYVKNENVKQNSIVSFEFPIIQEKVNIKQLRCSCGCNTPYYKNNKVIVDIKVGNIPQELHHQGYQMKSFKCRICYNISGGEQIEEVLEIDIKINKL